MKNTFFIAVNLFVIFAFTPSTDEKKEKVKINTLLDSWHKAAAQANFDNYFNLMATNSVFIGTDATENWDKAAFQSYAKPYFDKGKAWRFTPIERHVYLSKDLKTAWFDELLDTQMKICRGSGVLLKQNEEWKIKQYVLSMTVPNDSVDAVVKIKKPIEDALIRQLINLK
ncbi:MAG: nuclear transport factor 2 family protein [Burkholderiales bacterium]|nr:nuclear transport factor 2 family protein [Flavobacterium sp.]